MSDLNHQQFSTVQSVAQPLPTTLASAATLTPTTKFTRVTGTTKITTIVPPVSGYCELTLVFTSAYADALDTGVVTKGGIAVKYTSVIDRPIDVCFDPRTGLWYPKAVV
jgi:hypothetical protein